MTCHLDAGFIRTDEKRHVLLLYFMQAELIWIQSVEQWLPKPSRVGSFQCVLWHLAARLYQIKITISAFISMTNKRTQISLLFLCILVCAVALKGPASMVLRVSRWDTHNCNSHLSPSHLPPSQIHGICQEKTSWCSAALKHIGLGNCFRKT